MPVSLTGSVGQGGVNRADDVRRIFSLFNTILPSPLPVGDLCTQDLLQAILDFQKSFLTRPDGRIDVNGTTWKRLKAAAEGQTSGGRTTLVLSFDDGPAPVTALNSILEPTFRTPTAIFFIFHSNDIEKKRNYLPPYQVDRGAGEHLVQ